MHSIMIHVRGCRDHGLLWLLLHLRVGAKTLFKRHLCMRSYVSDEYGMSDEEAGNLYAAYGFACTGAESF